MHFLLQKKAQILRNLILNNLSTDQFHHLFSLIKSSHYVKKKKKTCKCQCLSFASSSERFRGWAGARGTRLSLHRSWYTLTAQQETIHLLPSAWLGHIRCASLTDVWMLLSRERSSHLCCQWQITAKNLCCIKLGKTLRKIYMDPKHKRYRQRRGRNGRVGRGEGWAAMGGGREGERGGNCSS